MMALSYLLLSSLTAVMFMSRLTFAMAALSTTPPLFIKDDVSTSSNTGCTYTAYTDPVISAGPTSTSYTLTTYTSSLYDCDGCDNIVVIVLGHIFVEESYTTTITATNATTQTLAQCSPTPDPAPSVM